MLNYIWAGLIIMSLGFALVNDVRDLRRDTYRNDTPLPVSLVFPAGYDPLVRQVPVTVRVDSASWAAHFGAGLAVNSSYPGQLIQTQLGRELRFARDATLPEPLATIRLTISERDNDLRGPVAFVAGAGDTLMAGGRHVRCGPVRQGLGHLPGRDRLRQDRRHPGPGAHRGDGALARDASNRGPGRTHQR